MRKWEAVSGGAVWALIAISMFSAALQPVEVSAAGAVRSAQVASLCADESAGPAGCDSARL